MASCDQPSAPVLDLWRWHRSSIVDWQVRQFNRQLDAILPENVFYRSKFQSAGIPLDARLKTIHDLAQFPFTTKQEWVEAAAQGGGLSPHHTYSYERYSRVHRTSGTRGVPLLIADTQEDWRWWSHTWQHVLTASGVTPRDRVFLAFSFGPFIGFWSAHQACADLGSMVIPAGGLTSLARLEFMRQSSATVACCTPSYALHLAEVACREGFSLSSLAVERIIVAGEPGGSLPSVRQAIEQNWQARVIDHAGATEVGPWGFGWPDRPGLHVIETSFIAEILPLGKGETEIGGTILPGAELAAARIDPADTSASESLESDLHGSTSLQEASDRGSVLGELVLTSLGRYGAPAIRYRTGDVVRMAAREQWPADRCHFCWLPDGIIGRTDDMITVRGVNIFPSAIDTLVRSVIGTAEYQVVLDRRRRLEQLGIRIEAPLDSAERLEKLLASRLGIRVDVASVPAGSLPRTEGKSQRWIHAGSRP